MGILATLGVLLGGPVPLAATPVDTRVSLAATAQARPQRSTATGTSIRSGSIEDLDANTEVRGEKWYGSQGRLGIAGRMLRDPHVRQSIEYIAGPLTSALWRFSPVSKDPLDVEVADFLTWAFFERQAWRGQLRNLVRKYSANGFALAEMTDDNLPIPASRFPAHRGGGIGLVPTGLFEIPAHTVDRWHQSKTNGSQMSGIRQFVQGSDGEAAGFREISSDRILRLTWDQDGAQFTGFAVLRGAYAPWKLKIAFQTLEAIKFERVAVPTPVVTASEDATEEDLDAAEDILAEMRSNEKGYVVLPNGYVFKWETGGGSDSANISAAIERCNKDIAINVSCGYMLLGLTGSTGSYALGTTQQTQHHLTVEGHAAFVAEALSIGCDGWSPAERIVRANYGASVAVPQAKALNLPTRNWAEVAKTVFNGVQVGGITMDDPLEDFLREAIQLPPRDITTARKARVSTPAPMAPGDTGTDAGDGEDDMQEAA